MNSSIALGCSHTYGTGVEPHQAWPALLGIENLGKPGCSTDYCTRLLRDTVKVHNIDTVYILYPDWSRFEYTQDGCVFQSLPTDKNRINFMETHDDDWCKNNFNKQCNNMRLMCDLYDILFVDLSLYDLETIIDHSDTWPKGTDGSHNGPQWHRWVADLFTVRKNYLEQTR
jgi:hypothetical protein